MMLRTCSILLVGAAILGCRGADSYDGPQRHALSGSVTFNGEIVDFGTIAFIPENSAQRVSGGPIENGKYLVPEAKGANEGRYRVEIRWAKPTGKKSRDADTGQAFDERKEGIPPRFNTQSELSVDVSPKHTTFDFDLSTSK